jgi:hypothetical protein
MRKDQIIFIIVLLAIVSVAIGVTQPTKIPFLNFKQEATGDLPPAAWRSALRLDENGILSGVSISAEALYINSGLGASNAVTGKGTISTGDSSVPIDNTNVTASSQIFITIGPESDEVKPLKLVSINPGVGFTVGTVDNSQVTGLDVDFNYLIIN